MCWNWLQIPLSLRSSEHKGSGGQGLKLTSHILPVLWYWQCVELQAVLILCCPWKCCFTVFFTNFSDQILSALPGCRLLFSLAAYGTFLSGVLFSLMGEKNNDPLLCCFTLCCDFRKITFKYIHKANSHMACHSPAMQYVNSHMPCRAPALLLQCRVLRESLRGSRKYPNC
jgi:hypothetical protein